MTIGHRAFGQSKFSQVESTDGTVLGTAKKDTFPDGSHLYTARTKDGLHLSAANSMSAILSQFEVHYPQHSGKDHHDEG